MKSTLYAIPIGLLALTACKPPALYEWGAYEPSLYKLMKDPSSLEKYGLALQKQIANGESQGKVPPGIYAEYGYVLAQGNQRQLAIPYFEKEKQRWPESLLLMNKMIASCRAPKANPKVESAPTPVQQSQPNVPVPSPKEGR